MLKRRGKLAQALLDYIMVFVAIVLIIAGVAYSIMNRGVGAIFNKVGNELEDSATNMNFE